jgi:putative RecB family exonuclease
MAQGTINHLSYSQVSTYLTCPLRYRFHYVDVIPSAFTSAALAFGSAIHEAVAAFYQTRLEGDDLRPDQMLDVYRDTWGKAENIKFFNGDGEESLREKAKQMLAVFHGSVDPSVTILGVEEFFEILLDGVPPFHGYIDLIEESQDGAVSVVDLKTASKKPSGSPAAGNLQLTAYSLGASAIGFDPADLTLRLDVITKTKSPELCRHETNRTETDRERFIKLVRQVWHAIEEHAFFPREDWHCVQCAYADHCKDW